MAWGWRYRELQRAEPGSGAPGLLQTLLMGMRPLCSAQYERMFNTTRIPGVEKGEDNPLLSPRPFLHWAEGKSRSLASLCGSLP